MKNTIATIMVLFFVLGYVNACDFDYVLDGSNINIAQFTRYNNGISRSCDLLNDGTNNYIKCCLDNNYVDGEYIFLTLDDSNSAFYDYLSINFTVQYTDTDTDVHMFTGLMLDNETDKINTTDVFLVTRSVFGPSNWGADVYSYDFGLVGSNFISNYWTASNLIEYNKNLEDNFVNLNFFDDVDVALPETKDLRLVPYVGLKAEASGSNGNDVCFAIHNLTMNSNITLKNTYVAIDKNFYPIQDVIISTDGLLGSTDDNLLTTNGFGNTLEMDLSPYCYANPIEFFGLYTAVYGDETKNGAISVYASETPKTTYIQFEGEDTCSQKVLVLYENNTIVDNAEVTVLAPDGTIHYSSYSDTSNLYTFNFPCQNYNLYLENLPNYPNSFYRQFYPSDNNVTIYLPNIPSNNADIKFKISDYGSLPMNDNKIKVYGCSDSSQCNKIGVSNCDNLYPYNKYTNSSGYGEFNFLEINNNYICGNSYYSNINGEWDYYKSIAYTGDKTYHFNFTYGVIENDYKVCFNFQNELTNSLVNANGSIYWDISGLEFTEENQVCVNTSNLDNEYEVRVDMQGYNYKIINHVFTEDIKNYTVFLTPSEITSDYKYYVYGTITNSSGSNLRQKITSSCSQYTFTSDSNGIYNFTNIVNNTECSFTTGDNLNYFKRTSTVNVLDNTRLDFVLTRIRENRQGILRFKVFYDDIYGTETAIEGVKTNIECLGKEPIIAYTDSKGYIEFFGLIENCNYIVNLKKSGYEEKQFTSSPKASIYKVKMTPLSFDNCKIEGYVYLLNNSVKQGYANKDVKILGQGGEIIKTTKSDISGYYQTYVKCQNTYNVELDDIENNNIKRETVKFINSEGSETLTVDIIIPYEDLQAQNFIKEITMVVFELLAIFKVIVVLFVLLILHLLTKEFQK